MKKPFLFQSFIAVGMIVQLSIGTSALAGSVAESILKSRHLLADKGNVDAQYKLGSMYELGIGTEKNLVLASNFYAKASSKGYVKAENRLRYLEMRKNGYDVQIHGHWLKGIKRDARNGDSQAAMLLGQMYSYGLGVNKDLDESIRLFNKADLNNPVILFEIDRVEKERKLLAKLKLERKQRAEAEKANKLATAVKNKAMAEARKKADKKRRYAEYRRKLKEEERLIEEQQAWSEKEEVGAKKIVKTRKPAPKTAPKAKLLAKNKVDTKPKRSRRYLEMMRKLKEEERILNAQQAWAEAK